MNQQRVDKKKDRFYKANGYEVIRVEAYNEQHAFAAAEIVERMRSL
jgi:hypothetical protein